MSSVSAPKSPKLPDPTSEANQSQAVQWVQGFVGKKQGLLEVAFRGVGTRAVEDRDRRALCRAVPLRGQVMSIANAAYDDDWAEVVRLAQTGPSLNEPLALAKKEPGGLHAS